MGVPGPRRGGDGGQRSVLGRRVGARVALGPRDALGRLGVLPADGDVTAVKTHAVVQWKRLH